MSRNSKGYRNVARRKANTLARKSGGGAAKTKPLHNKRWTYRSNPEIAKRITEMLKATAASDVSSKTKTSGQAILAKAGGASKD
jgi:hypothetical protein